MIEHVGKWAFVAGLVLSIAGGFLNVQQNYVLTVLIVLGLAVGFLNIRVKKSQEYLVAVIAILIIGSATIQAFDVLGTLYGIYTSILTSMVAFVASSGIVVAIKEILMINKVEKLEDIVK